MPQHMASQRGLVALDKRKLSLELRRKGLTYEQIAEQVGYSDRSGAYNAVRSAMQATLNEPADELRQLEMERLDNLQAASWADAMTGDVKAGAFVLSVMARRAKLYGLDYGPENFIPIETMRTFLSELSQALEEYLKPEQLQELRRRVKAMLAGAVKGNG